MNNRSVVLCEGEMDQVILSYYFDRKFDYKYKKKLPNFLNENSQEESVCLYKRENGDELIIWAVGNHELLSKAFDEVLNMNYKNTDSIYGRIVIIGDHDSESENDKLWREVNEKMKEQGIKENLQEKKWVKTTQEIAFDEEMQLKILGLSIPLDKKGALETFLLDALGEQEGNKYLAEQSNDFVQSLIKNREKMGGYLSKRRLCVKAPLCVFFAIANPERALDPFRKMLLSVPWDKYHFVQSSFSLLDEFKCDS